MNLDARRGGGGSPGACWPVTPGRRPMRRPFTKVIDAVKRQDDPAAAADAAAAVFAAILALLDTFIGEPLAARLVRQAWPEAVSTADTEET